MAPLILFNKPFGLLSQFTDHDHEAQRPTLAGFISLSGVYPASRLDYDSEGLLLLTDDGGWQAQIADPRFKLPKTYWAQVEGIPDQAALAALDSPPSA
ncbi:pseudouridine synthase [Methylotetracoccus oryzae]|uniref:pseudouridine synthase n=1 Tax=Methylotetracoccus oryzae TaxID=1919059 RepID=UPI001118E209|nr:pseudouridine synthase [Methylotetracoccus oryzae]